MRSSFAHLPESLQRQFAVLERRMWRVETVIAICGAMGAVFLSYLLLFLSDRFWETPEWLRVAVLLAGVGFAVFCGLWWLRRWVLSPRGEENLAVFVQRHYRRLGDRLLGAVELAHEEKRPVDVSPALCRAAIAQVAKESEEVDFAKAVATTRVRQGLTVVLALLAAAAIAAAVVPEAARNALFRWLLPVGNLPRFTFVTIDDLPSELVVAHGEPFELRFGVGYRSFWKPEVVTAFFPEESIREAKVEKGQATFRFGGQTETRVLTVRIGDLSRRVEIKPMLRPELKTLKALVSLPRYLQRPPVTKGLQNGGLTLLEGSRAVLKGETTRGLKHAWLNGDTALPVSGATFATETLEPIGDSALELKWQDWYGLSPRHPFTLRTAMEQDQRPEVQFEGLGRAVAILESEVLNLNLSADDDYGLREIGLAFEAYSTKGDKDRAIVQRRLAVREGSPDAEVLESPYPFSPAGLAIPPGTLVRVRATATDFYPDRDPSESVEHQVYVLGEVEHAELIRKEFAKLAAVLEEITREQDTLVSETQQTGDKSEAELANADAEIADREASQRKNREDLERLSKEAVQMLEEALRNPSIDQKLLEQWAAMAEAMRAIASGSMQQSQSALGEAQSMSSERREKLAEALEQERAALQALQEMLQRMNINLDEMQARNFAARLRDLGRSELEISANLGNLIPAVIGLEPDAIPFAENIRLNDAALRQQSVHVEARQLQDEISHFFQRTQIIPYSEVVMEMEEKDMRSELWNIALMVRKNLSVGALDQAEAWAEQFEEWAKILDEAKKSNGQSTAQSGPMSKEMLELLLSLLKLRQGESNLRDQTRFADSQRHLLPELKRHADRLVEEQLRLMEETQAIRTKYPIPALRRTLGEVHELMDSVRLLLDEPRVDVATVSAESAVIEMLSNLLRSQCQGQGMAALSGLFGMPGMGGGGNPALAESDIETGFSGGTNAGSDPESRSVEKLSGRSARETPAEFRDALESFYNALREGER